MLIIDDQPANVRLLSLLMTSSGYTVISALGGEQGLALARSMNPDVVLLDMRMPGMDGFGVLAAMRDEHGLGGIPVILLTADNSRDSLERAYEAGATDFIAKPFVPQELLARVRTQADLKQTRDALKLAEQLKQAAAELFAHDLGAFFTDIVLASNRQCALPQASPSSITLANEIRSSAGAGLDFLRASIDGHETKPGD